MSCEEVRDLLYLYVTKELDEAEVQEIESHLVSCSSCSAALEEHRSLATELIDRFAKKVNDGSVQ